jgi:hypothetical protein
MTTPEYPWYRLVEGDDIEQGDVFEACPAFVPPEDIGDEPADATFRCEERDLVVLSQSCDLVRGRDKLPAVLLCAVWNQTDLSGGHLATAKGMEDARRGNLPGVQLLAACNLAGLEREVRLVDFRHVHTLPLPFLRRWAEKSGPRLRLLPPYREHLSQAFARFFMRVGLPTDIPPFR